MIADETDMARVACEGCGREHSRLFGRVIRRQITFLGRPLLIPIQDYDWSFVLNSNRTFGSQPCEY